MIIRACLCIPTYNNITTIEQVVLDSLMNTLLPILVVDDGSDKPVIDSLRSLQSLEALRSGRLRVLRLDRNRGKGAALQHAFTDCVTRGFTHMLTIDGDGQHFASEAQRLLAVAKNHPWDLVIGARKLVSSNVPNVSKFGRRFSNFWVQFETGAQISDSQSGFRLYPLFHVQNLKFWTRRYDFEIEVLIRLLWNGVGIHEVEIDVYYPKPGDRVSHFNKF